MWHFRGYASLSSVHFFSLFAYFLLDKEESSARKRQDMGRAAHTLCLSSLVTSEDVECSNVVGGVAGTNALTHINNASFHVQLYATTIRTLLNSGKTLILDTCNYLC
jgi:hypothetical protein